MRTLLVVVLGLLVAGLVVRRLSQPPCPPAASTARIRLSPTEQRKLPGEAVCPGPSCTLSEEDLAASCPGPSCVLTEATLASTKLPPAGSRTASATKGASRGHEFIGGAVGYAERPGNTERRYTTAQPPRNATLLLLGVVSGSKNFDVRSWVRRAFWLQRPWRIGVDWRFVVGTSLPRGDNDRVSLHYEAARHGDMDLVRGSEVPPRQARIPIRWWLHAAARATSPSGGPPPRYIGLAYDSILVSLPRVALRLRSFGRAVLRSQQRAQAQNGGTRSVSEPPRLVYAGSLRWAAWADRPTGRGGTWRCVAASTPPELLGARLAGDAALPAAPLSASQRRIAGGRRRKCTGGEAGSFLAASPELQILSTPLLVRARGSLAHRLHAQNLEVQPPPDLWDRSEKFHQTAAGRTPSGPALLAATALARAVRNVTSASVGGGDTTPPQVAYLQLHAATQLAAFSWEVEPRLYPGPRALFARGVVDGIMAEAVAERFSRQRADASSAVGRMLCSRTRCVEWGADAGVAGAAEALCCEEEQAPPFPSR